MVDFAVLRDVGQVRSKVRPLNFRKANFQFFKELVNRVPWETALRDTGAELSWQIFTEVFHSSRASNFHEQETEQGRQENGRLSRELLVKLKGKKRRHRQWK